VRVIVGRFSVTFNRLNVTTRQITSEFVDQIARAAAPQPA
jgi:hypothetical protein